MTDIHVMAERDRWEEWRKRVMETEKKTELKAEENSFIVVSTH